MVEEIKLKEVKKEVKEVDKPLLLWDVVFLGSPYFDQIVLLRPSSVPCQLCPIFPLEKKSLRQGFVRKSGESGYRLKPGILPEIGRQVRVEIRMVR